MRLGGPVVGTWDSPVAWAALARRSGYSAVVCPLDEIADAAPIAAYARAAAAADLVIAEVGAWSNPLSPDAATRRAAVAQCQQRLALAEAIGARCCVNIAGSRGDQWDGPHPDNLTADTFALIVDTVRHIVDAVRPTRTFYTLEPMPWLYPDSPESYLALLAAIDRLACAVHLDPVNWISSPQRYYGNGAFVRACFAALGPRIKSCHAKDIALRPSLTICRLGAGLPGKRLPAAAPRPCPSGPCVPQRRCAAVAGELRCDSVLTTGFVRVASAGPGQNPAFARRRSATTELTERACGFSHSPSNRGCKPKPPAFS